MGDVYRVRDCELNETIALKVLPAVADAVALERLRCEVRLARRVTDTHVCRVFDIVELGDGRWGITMALVEGTTLAAWMRKYGSAQDYARWARWGADIAEGLAAAHQLSIVHRDLKPDNIMIRQADDAAVILDFGVAYQRAESRRSAPIPAHPPTDRQRRLTAHGALVGTLPYMSPEQLSQQALDGRSDLYVLGLILAELLTGSVPRDGQSRSALVQARVTAPTPYDIRQCDRAVPDTLANVVNELLRTQPEERPASAHVVAERLRRIAEDLTSPPRQAPHQLRRRPRFVRVAWVAALLGLVMTVIFAAKGHISFRRETARTEASVPRPSADWGADRTRRRTADGATSHPLRSVGFDLEVTSVPTLRLPSVEAQISRPVVGPNGTVFVAAYLTLPQFQARIHRTLVRAGLEATRQTQVAKTLRTLFEDGSIDDLLRFEGARPAGHPKWATYPVGMVASDQEGLVILATGIVPTDGSSDAARRATERALAELKHIVDTVAVWAAKDYQSATLAQTEPQPEVQVDAEVPYAAAGYRRSGRRRVRLPDVAAALSAAVSGPDGAVHVAAFLTVRQIARRLQGQRAQAIAQAIGAEDAPAEPRTLTISTRTSMTPPTWLRVASGVYVGIQAGKGVPFTIATGVVSAGAGEDAHATARQRAVAGLGQQIEAAFRPNTTGRRQLGGCCASGSPRRTTVPL